MMREADGKGGGGRILVKLRPTADLQAAGARARMERLYPEAGEGPDGGPLSFSGRGEPEWFLAEVEGEAATPWDLAHSRVADALGLDEGDILFAEPDLLHDLYPHEPGWSPEGPDGEGGPAPTPKGPALLGADCDPGGQEGSGGRALGPDTFAWHLGDGFSQLEQAREEVAFSDPRTRIAILDTGYYPPHVTVPPGLRSDLARNFVRGEDDESAEDPGRRHRILDHSGHGTGTLGILAGGPLPASTGRPLGGAPEAEVVPLRIAGRVVLFRTSAFARALHYAVDVECDVVSLSMGGLPSRAWREAIDRAYEAGVCVVAAAGNNYSALPTPNVVYPARYGRVIAACGVMADDRPYFGLSATTMQGNHGPNRIMTSALAAYTPNIPWPLMGCPEEARLNGAGTSSATPQIAAAVALWLEKYKAEMGRDWRRVEAVRKALFETAREGREGGHLRHGVREKLGHGILQARQALAVRPSLGLEKTPSDRDFFAFFRVLTGIGFTGPTPREEMFNLELMQLWVTSPVLRDLVSDPEGTEELGRDRRRKVLEAVVEEPRASRALRGHMAERYRLVTGRPAPPVPERVGDPTPEPPPAVGSQPPLSPPVRRRLRVFARDPSFSLRLETADMNEVTLEIPWEEDLGPGPVGEYLAVEDRGPEGELYDGVDLNHPWILAQDGWDPSEGNAQFHQQMVYAVAMKTIAHFERALGRPVLWRPKGSEEDPEFVRRLTVRPHAVRQANAFYSPREVALRFGFFESRAQDPGNHLPGSRIYTCLSHDIIAHETSHAVLDGMHRRFTEPTNPDVLALHEAFADLVALLQHFTLPGLLEQEIRRTGGELEEATLLGRMAVQFGHATGRGGALREAVGRMVDGRWKRLQPDPAELEKRRSPHARGAILVAAVFDAFLAVYRRRVGDLLGLAGSGGGRSPSGTLHPYLVARLAEEAATSADHVLTMCIRALDYLPPTDVTFFEYLRALITADFDLVPEDRLDYRVAFLEAFRRRGIYPLELRNPRPGTPLTLSVDTLRWQGMEESVLPTEARDLLAPDGEILKELQAYADACLYLPDREGLFRRTLEIRRRLEATVRDAVMGTPELATALGMDPELPVQVEEVRRASRISPEGRYLPQVVVSLLQEREVDEEEGGPPDGVRFRGGSTLVVDLTVPEVKYRIYKNVRSRHRLERTLDFIAENQADPLRRLLLDQKETEPFRVLHELAEES